VGSRGGEVLEKVLLFMFLLFMIISGMTLLNMLIGVLCQVIEESSNEEEEKHQVAMMRESFRQAFKVIDTTEDNYICEKEWVQVRNMPEIRDALKKLGVEERFIDERLKQMQETLFGMPGKQGASPKQDGEESEGSEDEAIILGEVKASQTGAASRPASPLHSSGRYQAQHGWRRAARLLPDHLSLSPHRPYPCACSHASGSCVSPTSAPHSPACPSCLDTCFATVR